MAVFAVAHRAVEADRVTAHRRHPPGLVYGCAGPGGDLLDRRLAAIFLEQLPGHVPHSAHRLDHVHRDADRAALVGHRAGDRLPNPPGCIGAELKAAAILELVDRPHEPRVALLDQVEEGQSTVAILLRDRDNEPKVALGEPPFGLLILGEDQSDLVHPPLEAAGRLLAGLEDATILVDKLLASSRKLFAPLARIDLALDLLEPVDEAVERRDHRLDPLRPQAQFLDQPDNPFPSQSEPHPGQPPLHHPPLLRERDPVVGSVLGDQHLERPQVVRQPPQDLVLLQPVGYGHLDGAVEGELSAMNAAEHAECLLSDILTLEQLRPELGPRRLDLPGEEDLLGPGEQRDLAHLREIHPDRIVGPVLDLLGHYVIAAVVGIAIAIGISVGRVCRENRHLSVVGKQFGIGLLGIDHLLGELLDLLGVGDDIVLEFIQQRVVQFKAPWRFLRSDRSIVRLGPLCGVATPCHYSGCRQCDSRGRQVQRCRRGTEKSLLDVTGMPLWRGWLGVSAPSCGGWEGQAECGRHAGTYQGLRGT